MIHYLRFKKQKEIKELKKMVDFAIEIYTDVVVMALPIAIVFAFGNLIVNTFMRVAFGGKLWFGK